MANRAEVVEGLPKVAIISNQSKNLFRRGLAEQNARRQTMSSQTLNR